MIRHTKSILLGLVLATLLATLLVIIALQRASTDSTSKSNWLPALKPALKKVGKKDISEFGLEIAKLDIWAPIIPDVDGYDKDVYLKKIENGVAQFEGTKNPDKPGNLFIFGHSKYYKEKPGDYKEVFKTLNRLVQGDRFNIYYKGKKYGYEVTDSKRVSKTDWSIMDPTPGIKDDKTVTIMTCWPPGALDARWVVFATQIE
jgi:LPXTG-site transpeptidase (sortase) family protein